MRSTNERGDAKCRASAAQSCEAELQDRAIDFDKEMPARYAKSTNPLSNQGSRLC